MKTKLFSVTKDDCRWDTFRSGGKGGQNQNKVESGVRCVHEPSGGVGEARDSRDQLHNRRNAFKRMVASKEFQRWMKIEIGRRLGQPTVEDIVDKWMDEANMIIENVPSR